MGCTWFDKQEMRMHIYIYIWIPGLRSKGEAGACFDRSFRLSFMTTAPCCSGCRGKWPLLVQGETRCDVCAGLFRLEHLVRGTRFPPGLGVTAGRHLQACCIQLLQEADLYYFQNPGREEVLLPHESKRESAGAPDNPRGEGDSGRSPKRKKDKAAKKEKESKKEKAANRHIKEEEEPARKEKKKHPRDEGAEPSGSRHVKEEQAEDRGHSLVSVKEEEIWEEYEQSESESQQERDRSVSRSKSPLPRRRPASSPPRPRSPPGPPPARPVQGVGETPGRWTGVIPAGGRPRRVEGEEAPAGVTPKFKARDPRTTGRKKKKNKGQKHRRRQEERRAGRRWGVDAP